MHMYHISLYIYVYTYIYIYIYTYIYALCINYYIILSREFSTFFVLEAPGSQHAVLPHLGFSNGPIYIMRKLYYNII